MNETQSNAAYVYLQWNYGDRVNSLPLAGIHSASQKTWRTQVQYSLR